MRIKNTYDMLSFVVIIAFHITRINERYINHVYLYDIDILSNKMSEINFDMSIHLSNIVIMLIYINIFYMLPSQKRKYLEPFKNSMHHTSINFALSIIMLHIKLKIVRT